MRNCAFFVLLYIYRIKLVVILCQRNQKKLEKIKNMVKNLDINHDEIDLSVLQNFVTITKKLNDGRVHII